MNTMFRKIRRKDRELDRAETEQLLMKGTYGVLSINGGNGYPYGVPLSYAFTGDRIYLHCAPEGEKITRIRNDNRVAFSVVRDAVTLIDQFSVRYSSAIVFGKAYEVEGDEKFEALMLLIKKYSTEEYFEKGRTYAVNSLQKTVVIRINIDRISGKARK